LAISKSFCFDSIVFSEFRISFDIVSFVFSRVIFADSRFFSALSTSISHCFLFVSRVVSLDLSCSFDILISLFIFLVANLELRFA